VKKLPVCLVLFLFAFPLWTQNAPDDYVPDTWEDEFVEDEINPEEPAIPEKKKFRMKNRTVELSVGHFGFGISHNFIAAADIVQSPFYMLWNINDIIKDPVRIYHDPVLIDLDEFLNGYKFNVNAAIKPFSLNFNWKDRWGVGLDIGHVEVWGNMEIPHNVLRLGETKKEVFGAGGAVFVDVGIPFFFHAKDFKIKIRPAAYLPLFYAQPNIKYSYREISDEDSGLSGMKFEIDYSMRIYTLIDMNDMLQSLTDNAWNIPRENLGYDFGLCVEYPWSYWLDLGVDIVNIPVPYAAATLNHYAQVNGKFSFDNSSIDVDADSGKVNIIEEELWNMEDFEFFTSANRVSKTIYRPFVMLFYANYRPLDSKPLSLIPSLGFSLNWVYTQPASIEGGLSARYDFANMIITTVGINYNDRVFKNSIDFAFNFRAFEMDFGFSTQSPDFIKSWRGAGMGICFGIKSGW
jgi:hypothetical protein